MLRIYLPSFSLFPSQWPERCNLQHACVLDLD
nr:MAG TPA: Anaphase-promoting complex subunit 15 [Caudoviricetes sp.]